MAQHDGRRPGAPPGKPIGRPGKAAHRTTDAPADTTTTMLSGCPCGCRTQLPWFDDPDCVRHRPVPRPREQAVYDVEVLGLVPHDRAACAQCRAAAS